MNVANTPNRTEAEVGLLAVGKSGPWAVDIDETLSGPTRYFAQIEGPSVYLYVEIPSAEMVEDAIDFLANPRNARSQSASTTGMMSVYKTEQVQISLVKDDEFADRYFWVLETKCGPIVRLTVTEEDLNHLVRALHAVKEDMEGG